MAADGRPACRPWAVRLPAASRLLRGIAAHVPDELAGSVIPDLMAAGARTAQ